MTPSRAALSLVTPKPSTKQAILVLGMHRSGTSALTRLANLLGAELPSNLMPALAKNNELGFWESQTIADLHEEILVSGGSSWDDVAAFPRSWFDSAEARGFRDRMVEVLKAELGDSRLVVLKDPRMCRLVPFWRDVLRELGAEPRFLIPVRNPLEVAASLKARDGHIPAQSLLLWLRHLLDAELETRGAKRCFVTYSELLRDWNGVAGKIACDLEVAWPRTSHQANVEIEQFLNDSARHHRFSSDELNQRPDVVDWIKQAYAAALALGERDASASGILDEIRENLTRADSIYGPLLAQGRLELAKLIERNVSLDRTVAQADQELRARDARIEQLSEQLAGRNAEIVRHNQEAVATRERIHQLEQQLGAAEGLAADRELEIGRLSSELASRDAMLEGLREQCNQLSIRVEAVENDVAANREKLEARTNELTTANAQLSLSSLYISELEGEVTALRASGSWRVTRPLRWLTERLMRISRRRR